MSLDSPGRKKWLCAAQANHAAVSGRRKEEEVYVLTISSNVQREKNKQKNKTKQKRLSNYCRKQKEVDLV